MVKEDWLASKERNLTKRKYAPAGSWTRVEESAAPQDIRYPTGAFYSFTHDSSLQYYSTIPLLEVSLEVSSDSAGRYWLDTPSIV